MKVLNWVILLGIFLVSLSIIDSKEISDNQSEDQKICCHKFVYGDEMKKVNSEYEFESMGECKTQNNLTGERKEIVSNDYCIKENNSEDNETEVEEEDCYSCTKWNDCTNHTKTRTCEKIANCTSENDEDNEIPKTTKKCEIKDKERKRLKIGECPEKCECSGSTIKCELEDGTRMMTIHAGKSGNIIVQIKGINITTNVTLYKENNSIFGEFKGKTREIKILPDRIKEKIKEKLENEDIELDDNGNYNIKADKDSKLFFLIPVKEKVEMEMNSETGKITKTKSSWWGFLAKDQ